jgi:hypothetical protein
MFNMIRALGENSILSSISIEKLETTILLVNLRSTSLSISFQVSKISTCQMLGTPASL